MKKNWFFSVIILILLAAVYNIVVFVAPFTRNLSFWLAYGVTTFSLAFQIISGLIIFCSAKKASSRTAFYVGCVYLTLQLIVGFLFMLLPIKIWLAVIVYVILFAITLICIIGTAIGKPYTSEIEHQKSLESEFLKDIRGKLELNLIKTEDISLISEIKNLISLVKYSYQNSHEMLDLIEKQIAEKVAALSSAIEAKDNESAKSLIGEISKLVAERNHKCKLLK